MPGRGFFSMASACSGMSGRVQASGAGDRSSVLVSPVTLNTVTVSLPALRAAGEPFGVGPGLQHGLGVGVALVGLRLDVVEIVEHQQGLLQAFGGDGADLRVLEQVDQRIDVEAAEHGAEQFGGSLRETSAFFSSPLATCVEEAGLDLGGVVDARRDAMGQQVDEKRFFAGRRAAQQGDQALGLLGRQRQRRNSKSGALRHMSAIGFKHRHHQLFPCE